MLGRIAMDMTEETEGEPNEDTLRCVYDLGLTLSRVHRDLEAVFMFRRVWKGRLTLLGPDHPDTFESMCRPWPSTVPYPIDVLPQVSQRTSPR
jgi:hypothetical protein